MIETYTNLIPIHVLQSITNEICSVEVAFVIPLHPELVKEKDNTDGKNNSSSMYVVRFFTKTDEMPFCGHASFAAAHILLNVLPSSSSHNKQSLVNNSETATVNYITPSQVQFVTKGNGIVHIRKCNAQDSTINNSNKVQVNA